MKRSGSQSLWEEGGGRKVSVHSPNSSELSEAALKVKAWGKDKTLNYIVKSLFCRLQSSGQTLSSSQF